MFSDKKRGTLLSGFLPQIMKDDMLCTFCKDHIGILDQDLYRDEVRLGAVCDSIRDSDGLVWEWAGVVVGWMAEINEKRERDCGSVNIRCPFSCTGIRVVIG